MHRTLVTVDEVPQRVETHNAQKESAFVFELLDIYHDLIDVID